MIRNTEISDLYICKHLPVHTFTLPAKIKCSRPYTPGIPSLQTHFRFFVSTEHRRQVMSWISDTPCTGANILMTQIQDIYLAVHYYNKVRSACSARYDTASAILHNLQRVNLTAFSHWNCFLSSWLAYTIILTKKQWLFENVSLSTVIILE